MASQWQRSCCTSMIELFYVLLYIINYLLQIMQVAICIADEYDLVWIQDRLVLERCTHCQNGLFVGMDGLFGVLQMPYLLDY